MGFYLIGVGWVRFFLRENRSRLYPHMRAKFGRDPTAGSKKVTFKFISRLLLCGMASRKFKIYVSSFSCTCSYETISRMNEVKAESAST